MDDVKLAEIDDESLMNGDRTTKSKCNKDQQHRSLLGVPNIERLVCGKDQFVGTSASDMGDSSTPTVQEVNMRVLSSSTMLAGPSETKYSTNNNTQMIRNAVKKFDRETVYCYNKFSYLWRDYQAENNKPAENDDTTIDKKDSSKRSLNRHLQAIHKDYDLVILWVGVWELASPQACEKDEPEKSTSPFRVSTMLSWLERNSPNDLQLLYELVALIQDMLTIASYLT